MKKSSLQNGLRQVLLSLQQWAARFRVFGIPGPPGPKGDPGLTTVVTEFVSRRPMTEGEVERLYEKTFGSKEHPVMELCDCIFQKSP